ncbi:MAG: SGNH/GDSL hydrolase family protein [Lachnospiraceae bacterium]|nr:SGNH/GDSL hydrolase family protein [Lachnospiraceae bacterium]
MKEILIRIGCVLLGVVLTLSTMKIGDFVKSNNDSETVLVEEMPITEASVTNMPEDITVAENVLLYSDYEAEAEERMQQLRAESEKSALTKEEKEDGEESETASGNSLKWNEDFPFINSTISLENRVKERSSYDETMAMNAFDRKVIEECTVDFSDVKITIMGDSITAATNLPEEDREKYSYPSVLQDILGCKEVVNKGVGGSTVSSCANNDPMVDRWHGIPADSDIIIVFGGSNDCLFENIWEFGHIDYDLRMNEDTFCGDLDRMCSAMKYAYIDHNPDPGQQVKMFYINPPSTVLNDAVYNSNPERKVHQKDFAEAINAIVTSYEFDVIDMYNNNILNTHDEKVRELLVPDGIHPNEEGYRIIAEHIASQIIQRIEQ